MMVYGIKMEDMYIRTVMEYSTEFAENGLAAVLTAKLKNMMAAM
jgi:hypothetical protein